MTIITTRIYYQIHPSFERKKIQMKFVITFLREIDPSFERKKIQIQMKIVITFLREIARINCVCGFERFIYKNA